MSPLESLRRTLIALAVTFGFLGVAVPPAHAEDAWLGRDKVLHFGVSVAIAGAGYGASSVWLERRAWRFVAGSSLALSVGAAKEIWDATGHGDPSRRDFTWDVLGAVVGASLALGLDFAIARPRKAKLRGFRPLTVRF
jgi:putative lipoprotein